MKKITSKSVHTARNRVLPVFDLLMIIGTAKNKTNAVFTRVALRVASLSHHGYSVSRSGGSLARAL